MRNFRVERIRQERYTNTEFSMASVTKINWTGLRIMKNIKVNRRKKSQETDETGMTKSILEIMCNRPSNRKEVVDESKECTS